MRPPFHVVSSTREESVRPATPFFVPDNGLQRTPWPSVSHSHSRPRSMQRSSRRAPAASRVREQDPGSPPRAPRVRIESPVSPSQRKAKAQESAGNRSNGTWAATGFMHLDGEIGTDRADDARHSEEEAPVLLLMQSRDEDTDEDDSTTEGYSSQHEPMPNKADEAGAAVPRPASPVRVLVPSTPPHLVSANHLHQMPRNRKDVPPTKRRRSSAASPSWEADSSLEICTLHRNPGLEQPHQGNNKKRKQGEITEGVGQRVHTIQEMLPPPNVHTNDIIAVPHGKRGMATVAPSNPVPQVTSDNESDSDTDPTLLFAPILSKLHTSKSKTRALQARVRILEAALSESGTKGTRTVEKEPQEDLRQCDESFFASENRIRQLEGALTDRDAIILALREQLRQECESTAFLSKRVEDVIRSTQQRQQQHGVVVGSTGMTTAGRQLCQGCKMVLW
ncbi:hypothetical protein BC830DRAFT_840623 [Chytriomyces sp. MP71]|nr:hypothetical protein BC830DRAFT_840623 [Chytriomyces sp. MP71]